MRYVTLTSPRGAFAPKNHMNLTKYKKAMEEKIANYSINGYQNIYQRWVL